MIYEPAGRAREYAAHAANLYQGCPFGCIYCYAPLMLKKPRETFHTNVQARKDVLAKLAADLRRLERLDRLPERIHLCFTCDPYPPIEEELGVTRAAIEMFHAYNIGVDILTKAGKLARRDIPILTENDSFGVTLTTLDDAIAAEREPGAARPNKRIGNLQVARDRGVKTWVSLEPIFDPAEAIDVINRTHPFADVYKVGRLNYRPEAKGVDWERVAGDIKCQLELLGKEYYLKSELREALADRWSG